MRRAFRLPSSDEAFLNSTGREWETLSEGGLPWLLLHEFPVPSGYSQSMVTAALVIAPGYPDTQIDMVYFSPGLSRQDGKTINALSPQQLDGKPFQRWSRHRTTQNPWRPGIDDIPSHLELVRHWLEREFLR